MSVDKDKNYMKAVEALAEYETALNVLRQFEHSPEYQEVIQAFMHLKEDMLEKRNLVKSYLQAVNTTDQVKLGGFVRTAVSKKTMFDPTKLPVGVYKHAGVVTGVSADAISSLLLEGKIKEADIEASRYYTMSSVTVRVPPESNL